MRPFVGLRDGPRRMDHVVAGGGDDQQRPRRDAIDERDRRPVEDSLHRLERHRVFPGLEQRLRAAEEAADRLVPSQPAELAGAAADRNAPALLAPIASLAILLESDEQLVKLILAAQ